MISETIVFGDGNIINTTDIVEIEEKNVTFTIQKSKKNPKPKPNGFFAKLAYSETIYYDETKTFSCVILKVKGGTQIRGKVDGDGNFTGYNNQLYDFYTIYNDLSMIEFLVKNESNTLKVGNFYAYPGILKYSNYSKTNMRYDSHIKTKQDFIERYL